MPSDRASPSLSPPATAAASSIQLPAAITTPFPTGHHTLRDGFITRFEPGRGMPQLKSASSFFAMGDDSAGLDSDLWEIDKVRASHVFHKKRRNFRDVVYRMKRKLPSLQASSSRKEQLKPVECCKIDCNDENNMDFDDHEMDFQDWEIDSDERKIDDGYRKMSLDDSKHVIQHLSMENAGSRLEGNGLCNSHNRYRVGDMVWGKVKSHPWWPGQVFDPSLACSLARKTKRDGHVLVAFFGDGTFGWFQESDLIPFDSNFVDKAKQTSAPNFVSAVEDALDEVSRRFSSGLTCSCTKSQQSNHQEVVERPAKRRKTLNLDEQLLDVRKSFDPVVFLSSIKGLACAPLSSSQDPLSTTKVASQAFSLRDMSFISRDSSYQEFFKRLLEIADYNRGFANDEEHSLVDSPMDPLLQAHVKGAMEKETSGLLKVGWKVHNSKVLAFQNEGRKMDHAKRMQSKVSDERSTDHEVNIDLFECRKACQEKSSGENSKGLGVDGGSMKEGLIKKNGFNPGGLQDDLEKGVRDDPHTGIKRLSEDGIEEFRRDLKGFQEKSLEGRSKSCRVDDGSMKTGLINKNNFNARLQDGLEKNARNVHHAGIKRLSKGGLEEAGSEDLKDREHERKERKWLKQRRLDDKSKGVSDSEDDSLTLEKIRYDALPSERMEAESNHSHAVIEKSMKSLKRLMKSTKSGAELNLKSVTEPESAYSSLPGFQASKITVAKLADDVPWRSKVGKKEHNSGSSYGGEEMLKGENATIVTSDAILKVQCKDHTEAGDSSTCQNMVFDPLTESVVGGNSENDVSVQDNILNKQLSALNPTSERPEAFKSVGTLQVTTIVNAVVDEVGVANGMTHISSDNMENAMPLEMQTVEGGVGSFAVQVPEPSQRILVKMDKDIFQDDIPVGESLGVVVDPSQRIMQPVADNGAVPHLGKSSLPKSAKFRRLVKGPKVSHMQILVDKSFSEKGTGKNIFNELKSAVDSHCQIPDVETKNQSSTVNEEYLYESVHLCSHEFQESQKCHINCKKVEVEKPQQHDLADGVDCLQKFLNELLCLAIDHFSANSIETISKVLKFREAVYQGCLNHSYESFVQGASDQQTVNISHPKLIGENLNIVNNKIAVSEMSSSPEQDKQERLHKNGLTVALEKIKTSVLSTKRSSPSSISLRPIPDAKIPLRPLKHSHKQVSSIDNSSSKLMSEKDKVTSSSTNRNLPNEPAALCMKFPQTFVLPSEAQLQATFASFGSLSSSGTRVNRNAGSAQVVFRHGYDAEKALKHVQENSVFGQIPVSYTLKHILIAKPSEPARDFSDGSKGMQHADVSPFTTMTEKQEGNVAEGNPLGKLEHATSQGRVSLKSRQRKSHDMPCLSTKNAARIAFQGPRVEMEHLLPSTPTAESNVSNDQAASSKVDRSSNAVLPTAEGLASSATSSNAGVSTPLPDAPPDKTQSNRNSTHFPSKGAAHILNTEFMTRRSSSQSVSTTNVAAASTCLPNECNKPEQSLNTGTSPLSTPFLSEHYKSPGSMNDIGDQMLSLLQRVSALVGYSGSFVL